MAADGQPRKDARDLAAGGETPEDRIREAGRGTIVPPACMAPAAPAIARSAAIVPPAVDQCPFTVPSGKRRSRVPVRATLPAVVVFRPELLKLKFKAPVPAMISLSSK